MAVGRKEEAQAILAKYHGNGDVNAPLVQLEMREFEESIKTDGSDKRWCVSSAYAFRFGWMLIHL